MIQFRNPVLVLSIAVFAFGGAASCGDEVKPAGDKENPFPRFVQPLLAYWSESLTPALNAERALYRDVIEPLKERAYAFEDLTEFTKRGDPKAVLVEVCYSEDDCPAVFRHEVVPNELAPDLAVDQAQLLGEEKFLWLTRSLSEGKATTANVFIVLPAHQVDEKKDVTLGIRERYQLTKTGRSSDEFSWKRISRQIVPRRE